MTEVHKISGKEHMFVCLQSQRLFSQVRFVVGVYADDFQSYMYEPVST
jgi:hypothetical protein